MIVIVPGSGLCNRLRCMFSYLKKARTENKKLTVIWDPCIACNGYFQDIFQPIPDVTMLKKNSGCEVNYSGIYVHPEHNLSNIDLKDLQLLPHIKEKVHQICSKIKPYIAIHVRRTDHVKYINKIKGDQPTSDQHFFDFIDLHPQYNVYLATDNSSTQKMFAKRYPGRIFWNIGIQNSKKCRQTSLVDAAIDIFVCKDAAFFRGSNYSSFSGIIAILGNFNGHSDHNLLYCEP
jgi:hypothetical protein